MRIECPSCAAIYQVPDGLLAVGQSVSCARCGQAWMPIAPITASAPVAAVEPPSSVASPLAEPPAAVPPVAVPPVAAPPVAAPVVAMPTPTLAMPAAVQPPAIVRDEPVPQITPRAAPLPAAPLGVEPPALSPEDWPELSLPPEMRPAEAPRVEPANAAKPSAAPGWTAADPVEPGPAAPGRAADRMPVMGPDHGRADWFDRDEPGWATPERSALVPLAWIVNLVLLAGLCGAAVVERDWLMQSWPPSSRLFAALGLDDR